MAEVNPTRNSKLSASARERILQLYPTHSYKLINQILIEEGLLEAPGVSINAICKTIAKEKERRKAAVEAHKQEINRSIAEAVTPCLTADLAAMGDLAVDVVRIGRELEALAGEDITLFCETSVPRAREDGQIERPLVLVEGQPMLRMARDLDLEIKARNLRVKAKLAAVGCYRLAGMVRLTALQAAGMAPVTEEIPTVVLPNIEPVPEVPGDG